MTARRVTVVLVAALAVYLGLSADFAVILFQAGPWAAKGLGLAVVLVGIVGIYLVIAEVRFGFASQRLGGELGASPGDEQGPLPRTPAGRIDRAAADVFFAQRRLEVEADPDDWRAWFRLGIAYGDAGDTRRGRRAVRHAITLHDAPGADVVAAPGADADVVTGPEVGPAAGAADSARSAG